MDAARPDEASQTRARTALEKLCRTYWYPLYAFVRSRGYSANDAQDLTQAFFVRILETDGFGSADRTKGRFRSYLLGAMKHFLANEWHKAETQKRGGGIHFIEWDQLSPESRYGATSRLWDSPEHRFDSEWAVAIVSAALLTLRQEMEAAGKEAQFDLLKGNLTGESDLTREEIATKLNISKGAVKVAIHRLRRRYRELLRATVAETVTNEADLENEMRYLVEILRKGLNFL